MHMVIEKFASTFLHRSRTAFQHLLTTKNNAALTMIVAPNSPCEEHAASSDVGFEAARLRRRAVACLGLRAGGAVEDPSAGTHAPAYGEASSGRTIPVPKAPAAAQQPAGGGEVRK